VKGAGGIHAALKKVACTKDLYSHVLKSDAYHCYESIDHGVLLELLKHYVLRQVIRLTHKVLTQLKLTMHPDKTFLGRIKKGFDFLGVHFSDTPKISKTSQENHRVKLARRYAQGARVACIGAYKARWTSWCRSVLNSCTGKDVIKQAKGGLARWNQHN